MNHAHIDMNVISIKPTSVNCSTNISSGLTVRDQSGLTEMYVILLRHIHYKSFLFLLSSERGDVCPYCAENRSLEEKDCLATFT